MTVGIRTIAQRIALFATLVLLVGTMSIVGPGASYAAGKLPAPVLSANNDLGYVNLDWGLWYDDNDGTDEAKIDHFNVYCDGRLVAQVDVSAVEEDVWTDNATHSWELNYALSDKWTPHYFQVSSVAKDGTEGNLSDAESAQAYSQDVDIVGHDAWFHAVYNSDLQAYVKGMYIDYDVYAYFEKGERVMDVWRSEGTTPPDTSAQPYIHDASVAYGGEHHRFSVVDTNAVADKTYTYTARITGAGGRTSDFYTFTAKAVDKRYTTTGVTYEVVKNTTPTLTFSAYDNDGRTYAFYRDDVQIGSFDGTGTHSFSDRPTIDGVYTYRVDVTIDGFTYRGRSFTFTRDTSTLDPSTFPTKPDAPTLVGRTDTLGYPTLAWTPAESGGEVEGYHIYRTDDGTLVDGWYLYRFYTGSTTPLRWGMHRYLNVSADTTLFADRGDYYLDNAELGYLQAISWGSGYAPHEYYITAYNQYGESAPSNVVTFPYADGHVPSNNDAAVPAAPRVKWAWIEWLDSSDWYLSEHGTFDPAPGYVIRVAWEEPEDAATTVGSYRVEFDDDDANAYSVDRSLVLIDPQLTSGTSQYSPYYKEYSGSEFKYNKDFQITVYAVNEFGETASEPLTFHVGEPPRIAAAVNDGVVTVRWDYPVFSAAFVNSWELYKRPEHGLFTKVGEFESDVREYVDTDVRALWEYDYYVVAKTVDGDLRSAWPHVTIAGPSEPTGQLGAPKNLTATVVNGRVVLSWERPDNEGFRVSYYGAELKYPGSDEWVTRRNENNGILDFSLNCSEGLTLCKVDDLVDKDMQVRVYAQSAYDLSAAGRGEYSDVVTFRITSAQAAAHVDGTPGEILVSGEAGDGWCRVTWRTSTESGEAPATEYRVMRYGYEMGTVAAKGDGSYEYEYLDTNVTNGDRYPYQIFPVNSGTVRSDDYYGVGTTVWLSPNRKSHDQEVIEAVAEIIDSLPAPGDVTAADAALISEVAGILDGLSADQRKLLDEYDWTLSVKVADDVAAAEDLALLEVYGDVVTPVQARIDALPDPAAVTTGNASAIQAARAALEALSPAEAKGLVKDERLVACEEALAAAYVKEAIAALPDVGSLAPGDATAVSDARAAYEALTFSERLLVPRAMVEKLMACESVLAPRTITRIAGDYANETSALISQQAFPEGCDWVVIARDDDFADALGATGLAGTLHCPIILTDRFALSDAAREEIVRLGATNAYIIGGTGAIKTQVDDDLADIGVDVKPRLWGENSYDTSLACAVEIESLGGNTGVVIIAMSTNFQDALSMSTYAYKYKVPVILQTWGPTAADRGLTDEAWDWMAYKGKELIVAGGRGAISDESVSDFNVKVRLWGETGYDTSQAIADWMVQNGYLDPGKVVFACGAQAPKGTDALAGAALGGIYSAPMLLVNTNTAMEEANTTTVDGFLTDNKGDVRDVYVLGGAYVMPQDVYNRIASVIGA